MLLAVLNHLVETIALLCMHTGNTIICVNARDLPFRGGIDFLGVVQFLDFKAALLFFFLGADAAVGRHPQLAHRKALSLIEAGISMILMLPMAFPLTQFVRFAV